MCRRPCKWRAEATSLSSADKTPAISTSADRRPPTAAEARRMGRRRSAMVVVAADVMKRRRRRQQRQWWRRSTQSSPAPTPTRAKIIAPTKHQLRVRARPQVCKLVLSEAKRDETRRDVAIFTMNGESTLVTLDRSVARASARAA